MIRFILPYIYIYPYISLGSMAIPSLKNLLKILIVSQRIPAAGRTTPSSPRPAEVCAPPAP